MGRSTARPRPEPIGTKKAKGLRSSPSENALYPQSYADVDAHVISTLLPSKQAKVPPKSKPPEAANYSGLLLDVTAARKAPAVNKSLVGPIRKQSEAGVRSPAANEESRPHDRAQLRHMAQQQLSPSIHAYPSAKHGAVVPAAKPQQHSAKSEHSSIAASGDYRNGDALSPEQPHPQKSSAVRPLVQYTPYTLRDYKEIKPSRYFTLGGLGPNIGSQDWETKRNKLEKMFDFAKAINQANLTRFMSCTTRTIMPGRQIQPEVERALRAKQRMLDFAQRVPKPRLARITESDELDRTHETRTEPLSLLEKLERQHDGLLERIEQLKNHNK